MSYLRDAVVGGVGYPVLEMVWRGRTHGAMACAGAICLPVLRGISRMKRKKPLWKQALLGGLCVTAVEYGIGLCCNRRHQIWDYRRMPFNHRGQICAAYAAAWVGLSAVVLARMRKGA